MGLTDEIRKLKELRDSGALTEAEFTEAKAALLADSRNPGAPRPGEDQGIGSAANQWVSLQSKQMKLRVVMAIVGVVLVLAFFFGFFLPMWNKSKSDFDRKWNEFPGRSPSPSSR